MWAYSVPTVFLLVVFDPAIMLNEMDLLMMTVQGPIIYFKVFFNIVSYYNKGCKFATLACTQSLNFIIYIDKCNLFCLAGSL